MIFFPKHILWIIFLFFYFLFIYLFIFFVNPNFAFLSKKLDIVEYNPPPMPGLN